MATNGDVPVLWDESRQLGQLFMMGFDGTAVNEQVRALIETYYVGTILLTAKNLRSAAQTTQLVLDLQTIAQNAGHPVPLLIAIDQENGGVNSLYDEAHIRQFPSAMGIAATGSKKMARDVAKATALEMSSCGINWILGPVLDVLTTSRSQPLGSRSYGDDPKEVAAYSIESLKGYRDGNLATCGKHFPSYGNLEFFGAPTDVPVITDTLEQLSQSALAPFKSAIINKIDAMMVGGVAMTSPNMNVMHACLSERVVQDLLRHEMHFEGVVVSECLEMEALSRNIGIAGGTVMAFKAGCDIILTCRSLHVQEEAINGLRVGLDNGMIERYRIQESVARVLDLKSKYTSWESAFAPAGLDNLMRLQPSHIGLSVAAYNKSVTLVRDQKKLLPLSQSMPGGGALLLLTPLLKPLPASPAARYWTDSTNMPSPDQFQTSETSNSIRSGEKVFGEFGKALARRTSGKLFHTTYTQNGLRPAHENLISQARAVVVVTADAGRNMYQVAFAKYVAMLCKMNTDRDGGDQEKPCVVIAVSSPFDFAADLSMGTYLCTYDFSELALSTLAKVLFGDSSPTGTLPGTGSKKQKSSHVRQQWLVENLDVKRDSTAVDALLGLVQRERSINAGMVAGVSTASFLIGHPDVDEAHFVVRNSSTKELFGFCATYYYKPSMTGYVGAIIVDPQRRKLSIGESLHSRAVRDLMKQTNIQSLCLGCRLPAAFLGIPRSDVATYARLTKWFNRLGWNATVSRHISTLVLTNLHGWIPPLGLGQTLANADVKYDLVHGQEYAEVILNHVSGLSLQPVQVLYDIALQQKDTCSIIRAKRTLDGFVLGTLILVSTYSPRLADLFPAMSNVQSGTGAILSPVVSSLAPDPNVLTQGLVLLGVRQLKRLGANAVYLDCVEDGPILNSLQSLGFEGLHKYDEVSSSSGTWLSTIRG